MRTNIKISFWVSLILTIFGCHTSEKKELQLILKEYGKLRNKNVNLGVELAYNQFESWKALLERTERIACNDSIPKITLKSNNEIKTIYFHNPCWENFACVLIKQRNVLEVHNDTININGSDLYPLDSLESILKRDIENNGKDPSLSYSSEMLLIYVSYDKRGFENLPKTLDKLTQAYERITNKKDIAILLH